MTRNNKKTIITTEIASLVVSKMDTEKYTVSQIAEALEITRQTVWRILRDKNRNIPFIEAKEKRKKTCNIRNSVNSEIEQFLNNAISVNNSMTQAEMRDMIAKTGAGYISQSTVSRKLKKMGITRKQLTLVPIERNTVERINQRRMYSLEISRISDENLIFLDETGFSEHTTREYGYSPAGNKAYVNVPANRKRDKSLLCAINKEGVIGYELKEGSYNGESFIGFINRVIVPYFYEHPTSILIMDNARIHKTQPVLSALVSGNIRYKFNVPYSPELNPIEEFFSMVKSRFSSIRVSNPTLSIGECVNHILGTGINYSSLCSGFYRNMRSWIVKGERGEEFI